MEVNMRPIAELAIELSTLPGHINAANHRFLVLLGEFDRRQGWSDGATQSCAHWLNWKCGIAVGAAREKVRVARALESLPKISAAMETGALSYSKVREITRVATAETEDTLLMVAEHGTASHVEKLVRAFRRCQEAEELSREARQQEGRRVTVRHDDDGSMVLLCRLPAEVGARLLKAIDIAVDDVPAGTSNEPRESFSARRADGLGVVAESFLAHGAMEMSGGDRNQIVVHVAAETLRDRRAGCCEMEDGPSIAAETARRMSCDASLIAMIEREDGEPLNVGRKTRAISPALWRLLKSRDKGCRFPGCANSRYMDGHHIIHWANGGETKPSNLVCLCRFHHRAVHEGGIRIDVLDDGALRFVKANGVVVDSTMAGCSQPRGDLRQLPAGVAATWRGEKMDVGLGVEILLQKANRACDVPAGTSVVDR
jgi:hypothetical protein